MNTLQNGILTLIRSALTQQPMSLPEDFSLEEAMPVIAVHHIHALCFEGATLCGIDIKSGPMQKLFKSYCVCVMKATGQDAAIKKLLTAFEENSIDYIPLKGSRMRPLYPKPELRTMGDADILIHLDQYEKIIPIVEALGYKLYSQTDHDHSWNNPSLFLELHHRLLSPEETAYTAIYADGWRAAKPVEGFRWGMEPEDEWLYLFGHFTKHYSNGIGIRHVTDLWMFLRNYPQLNQEYIVGKIRQLGQDTYYNNVLALIRYWFENGEGSEVLEFMTDYVFSCGSWGTRSNHQVSQVVKGTARNKGRVRQFICKIGIFIFPSRADMAKTFPAVGRHPWLYPFLVPVRPIYRLIIERGRGKQWVATVGVYSKDRVDEKRRQLEYVGLKINR